jgi:signal transduction histidine kinase
VRRRLLVLVFTTTLFALTLLGVILMSAIWAATDSAALERAQANARVDAAALGRILAAGGAVDQQTVDELVRDQASLMATLPDGTVLTAGGPIEGDAYVATAEHAGVTVTAAIPKSFYVQRTLGEAALVVAISIVALAIAMLVANYYARRITRPLEDFAVAAERIATGDSRPVSQRYGVPELDKVADVLDRGASSFTELLESERRATAEASHQLRTPLTGLSLRLEEILASDDLDVVHAEATAALGQVERLAGVVDEVVSLNRGQTAVPEPVPVDELVQGRITEWAPAFDAAGRRLRRAGTRGLVVWAMAGAQAQALATLIENSLVHGQGTTTVRTRAAGAWSVIEVGDEGPGVPEELGQRVFDRHVSGSQSSGLGLALARTIVVSAGGRLELVSARPAVFAMFLPATGRPAEGATAQGSPGAAGPDQAEVEMAASSAASVSSGNTQRR